MISQVSLSLLLLLAASISLRAAKPTPTPNPDAASEVKVTLKSVDGGATIAAASTTSAQAHSKPASPSSTAPASSGSPIYANRLNDVTGLDLKNGASIGADASGVSGLAGDKGYLAVPAPAASTAGPMALLTTGPSTPVTGDELTVTVWYKPDGEVKDAATLFNGFGSSLLWEAKAASWIWRVASSAAKDPTNPKALTWYSTGKAPVTPGQWTFLALVWKREGNTAQCYIGSTTAPLTLANTLTRKEIVESFTEPSAMKRVIGNDPNKGDRAFTGSVDDLRVFSKALGSGDLEKIRHADLKNLPPSL